MNSKKDNLFLLSPIKSNTIMSTTLNVIFVALCTSMGLVKQQIVTTFGRETSVIDKEVVDVILSNPLNKQKLISKLNESKNSSIEIKIEGDGFSFVSN